jgi:hypothetical protein
LLAVLELAVIVILYLSYSPFQRTTRSGDEACSPMEELIPFLNDLDKKHRQQLFLSLGNALLLRIAFENGKECYQLINVLHNQLPRSHDYRPAEDACVLLLEDIAECRMPSREAFLSRRKSLHNMIVQSTERRCSTGEIRQEGV